MFLPFRGRLREGAESYAKPARASSPDRCQHWIMRFIAFGAPDEDFRTVPLAAILPIFLVH